MLLHKPTELSWEQAAGIPEVCISYLSRQFLAIDSLKFPSVLDLSLMHRASLYSNITSPGAKYLYFCSLNCLSFLLNTEIGHHIDMDHSNPSPLSRRRVCTREVYPLARGRLLRLYIWNPALKSRQRISNFRNRRLRREDRLLRQRTGSYRWYVSLSLFSLNTKSSSPPILNTSPPNQIRWMPSNAQIRSGFNYNTQDWSAEILKATDGKGVDIIIDFIGASYFQGNLDCAARDGRIVHLGAMGGIKLKEGIDISPFIKKRIRFEGSSLRSRDEAYQVLPPLIPLLKTFTRP